MVRTLAGAAVGIAVAIVLMMLVEAVGNAMFPPPPIDLQNPNAPAALPLPNQLAPLLGWFLASLLGGWLAIRVSRRKWTSWIVAASVLAGELLDFALGRHAGWVMIAGVLVPLAGAWIAQNLPARPTTLSA